MGNVLVSFDWARGYQALAELCSHSPAEVRRRIKESGLFDTMERGHIEAREAARRVGDLLGFDVPFERFREAWSSIFSPEALFPEDLLAALRRQRRLLLLSNTDVIHYRWILEKYRLLQHFDGFVLSFETGSRKPEPEIYEHAIALAGCPAGEVFFADDRPENVDGALAVGVDAVQFQSIEQIRRDLSSRGLTL